MKKNILLISILLTIFCVRSSFAQSNSNQCENYGKKDFKGKLINLNVVDTDLKDILNKITNEFGCNFVVDKSVETKTLTLRVEDVPWNILLDAILMSQDLGRQIIDKSLVRVAKADVLASWRDDVRTNKDKEDPLYTEFIKLNYLQASNSGFACTFEKTYTPSPPSKIVRLVSKLLSNRGAIETDNRSNSLVITDTKERVDLILNKLRDWDKPDTNLDEIIEAFESKNSEN